MLLHIATVSLLLKAFPPVWMMAGASSVYCGVTAIARHDWMNPDHFRSESRRHASCSGKRMMPPAACRFVTTWRCHTCHNDLEDTDVSLWNMDNEVQTIWKQ